MQTVSQIRSLLESRGLRPKRSLGQNFLIDQNLIRKIVACADLAEGDLVLEIGPGTGALTEALLGAGCRVVACELDDALASIVEEQADNMGASDRLTLVLGDCLEQKRRLNAQILDALGGQPFKLVANLPYGAATPVLSTLLISHAACSVMAVTIQREVADRLLGRVGEHEYGALSVIAQTLSTVERIATAPPSCFWPQPKVTSSMVRLTRTSDSGVVPEDLSRGCRLLFQNPRKQLGRVLGRETCQSLGLEPTLRAGQLDVKAVGAIACRLATLEEQSGASDEAG